ncbi:MAG TPA: UDP-N-acetylmuramyl-tripeptide synthetase, partial [Chloroflexi bacterium]|nr:UDP-N-acetylmuramyl-tripeptide synthetase [Chloroflexota bacterium]
YLAEMVKAGITHVVLEATSHGLAQKRVEACEFDIGVVTNITHEHFDYHGDYQGYLEAKAELFRLVGNSAAKSVPVKKVAVLNADDLSYPALKDIITQQGLDSFEYGMKDGVDFKAENIQNRIDGINFDLTTNDTRIPIKTALLGEYNVSNCLAAVGACSAGLGLSWESIQKGISDLLGIPGRMERIDLGQDYLVLVDFAHTPNALKVALSAAKELSDSRVIAVFGSAGLRDKEKRRLMAEVSAEMADLTVLTAEDPRTESLDGILTEMAGGMLDKGGVEGEDFWRVPDRGGAIRFALDLAQPGDVVMVCGKGHEQSMCFGETEYPWDDRTAVLSALASVLGTPGPEMPTLPTSK